MTKLSELRMCRNFVVTQPAGTPLIKPKEWCEVYGDHGKFKDMWDYAAYAQGQFGEEFLEQMTAWRDAVVKANATIDELREQLALKGTGR